MAGGGDEQPGPRVRSGRPAAQRLGDQIDRLAGAQIADQHQRRAARDDRTGVQPAQRGRADAGDQFRLREVPGGGVIAEPALLQEAVRHRGRLGGRDGQVLHQPVALTQHIGPAVGGVGQAVRQHLQQHRQAGGQHRTGDHQPLRVDRGIEVTADQGQVGIHLFPVARTRCREASWRRAFRPVRVLRGWSRRTGSAAAPRPAGCAASGRPPPSGRCPAPPWSPTVPGWSVVRLIGGMSRGPVAGAADLVGGTGRHWLGS